MTAPRTIAAPADAAAGDVPMRVILIRHGRPNIATAPRTSHREFRSYIDAYEEAGLDPESMPPEELQDLLGEIDAVFTSERKRSVDSARALAPHAELIADPLVRRSPARVAADPASEDEGAEMGGGRAHPLACRLPS